VIPRLRWEPRPNNGLALVIPAGKEGLNGERPAGRMAQLARITGRELSLVVS
jgi:exopolyphosphatase/guanosine-5'-triphosphate,3'-diphosphate pyrophosphatase